MNDSLNIETILGHVASEHPLRACRDGKAFEGMLPVPAWSETTVIRNGSVQDTVSEMKKIIENYSWQTEKIAPQLRGKDLYDTCQNIWNFLFSHIKYREDEEGQEQLRTPARSFAQRRTRGIDCDDFSIFCGCILRNLHIPFYIRIARYAGKDYFQHVYPVVPLTNKEYITIDAVLDKYDAEKPTVEHKDFLVMENEDLNGVDISVLGGIEDDTLNELSGILSGADFREVNEMEGLGRIPSRAQELSAIRNHLMRTRRIIQRRPDFIRHTEHPQEFLGMVDYALKYWDTDKRDEALGILAGEEDRINTIEGMGAFPEGHEDVELFYGLNDAGQYDVLGKAKRERKFFSKVRNAVKKAGAGLKKLAKGLIRFNPLTVTIRAAVLLALKVNLFKVSSKLKWGYLTEEEARSKGFDMDEWAKVKEQLAKAEKLFVKTLQGKAENFKRAIINGRAGKLSGADLGLGFVATAATAASTTAAVPFITKIIKLLKNINFKKLISKVNISKLAKGRKQAEEDTPTEEGGTSVPDNENPGESTPSDESETSAGVEDESGVKTDKAGATITDPNASDPTTSDPAAESGSENLPATQKNRAPATARETTDEGIVTKAMTWVKEHPTQSILIGGGAAFLIYQIMKPKAKTSLSGTHRRGKTHKGKAKRTPPQTISGIHKKKRRGRGRGGASKQVKL